jgi:hypothetical protein
MNAINPVDLDDHTIIPLDLQEELPGLKRVFEEHEYLEQCEDRHPDIRRIRRQLEARMMDWRIRAYHCTKEPRADYFRNAGLRLTNVDTHREEFLELFGSNFSSSALDSLKSNWRNTTALEKARRNGKIWVCLTRDLTLDDGCDRLFTYYGGEAIYKYVDEDTEALLTLASIGQPVVVEFVIGGHEIQNFQLRAAAWTVLSAWHRQINPRARKVDAETFITRAVPPAEILFVSPRNIPEA